MSGCRAIHYEDDTYIDLGLDAPPLYEEYDYGTTIYDLWNEVTSLSKALGLGDLDQFVCPEDTYLAVEDLREALDEARDANDEESVRALTRKLGERVGSHDPAKLLSVVRGLLRHLEGVEPAHPAAPAVVDLKAYKIALAQAAAEKRRVFISPF